MLGGGRHSFGADWPVTCGEAAWIGEWRMGCTSAVSLGGSKRKTAANSSPTGLVEPRQGDTLEASPRVGG